MPDHPYVDQINFVVRDLTRSARFYEALGVELPETGSEWDAHHRDAPSDAGADVDLDSIRFAGIWCEGWPEGTTGSVITFRVSDRADVDRLHDELAERGGRSLQAPYDAFWGSRFAVVTDPDGQAIGVMSVPDPDLRRPPPRPPD